MTGLRTSKRQRTVHWIVRKKAGRHVTACGRYVGEYPPGAEVTCGLCIRAWRKKFGQLTGKPTISQNGVGAAKLPGYY